MKLTTILTSAALSLTLAASANAADISWTLSNVVFDDGGTASGTFTTDSATGALTSYNIVTTVGNAFAGFAYNTSTSYKQGDNTWGPNSFWLRANDNSRYITLAFAHPLTGGPSDALMPGQLGGAAVGSWECTTCGSSGFRNVARGEAVSAAPEPAAWALMMTGIGGMGAALRTRRRKAVAA